MAYNNKRTFSNRGGSGSSNAGGSSSEEVTIELDKKKQVTIRKFNNINLVDIREFYIDKDSGEKRPGKKGISLTEDTWYKLLEATNKIQNALDTLNGRSSTVASITAAAAKKAKLDEKPKKKEPAPEIKKPAVAAAAAPPQVEEEEESDEDAYE
ncbi:transcriptional Coactivator p15-domain-containing protein [Scheffersomyces amazonensis]|uniref:transcriptional Coactivator p15-domain-containing protein n=1 Tax=Scheffersomyces amazonensis TaxID=1078765 RepID=UPI00315C6863